MQITECRSCREPIFWTVTEKGKNMPVDAEPDPEGKFVLEDEDAEKPRALYRPEAKGERYTAHFATCSEADEWRKDR
jgi:hypothetical protein